MSKAAVERLCRLKQWQLRYSAFLMGLPSGGTKSDLARGIYQAVHDPQPRKAVQRVVSVDMGIRNLAYCVMDANISKQPEEGPTTALVKTWKRVDLTAKQHDNAEAEDTGSEDTAFRPPVLARTAYKITRELLDYEPDVVLIEQQRWRSGGGASVQQWTIRVNTFESQLWACLQTLREIGQVGMSAFPTAFQVDPKRVADFFPTCQKGQSRFSGTMNSIEDFRAFEASLRRAPDSASGKKQKIDVIRSWLRDESSEGVSLTFEGPARLTADLVRTRIGIETVRKSGDSSKTRQSAVKVDDLADCLLQAVTWLRWQENRNTAWLERQQARDR